MEQNDWTPAPVPPRRAKRSRIPNLPLRRLRNPEVLTGAADANLARVLLTQLGDCLVIPVTADRDERATRFAGALAVLRSLAPRDAGEGLLATQMVAIHEATAECVRRASLAFDQSVRDSELRQAARLAGVYARQLEALSRMRARYEGSRAARAQAWEEHSRRVEERIAAQATPRPSVAEIAAVKTVAEEPAATLPA